MPSKTSNEITLFDVLLTCGIRLNLMRLEAEKAGRKYDRNKIILAFFTKYRNNKDQRIKTAANIIAKAKFRAGYAFDQYFKLYFGFKVTPDAADLGPIVKKGIEEYGITTAF